MIPESEYKYRLKVVSRDTEMWFTQNKNCDWFMPKLHPGRSMSFVFHVDKDYADLMTYIEAEEIRAIVLSTPDLNITTESIEIV